MAEALGGRLVSMETEAEADYVFDRLVAFHSLWTRTNYNGGPWVGLERVESAWRWSSGADLDWDPWASGEPNETGDKGCFFSFLDGPRRQLDDTFDSNVRRAFIVEFAPEASCPGDLDGNGVVDGGDLGLLLGSWGPCPSPCPADLDGNGAVDGGDLGLMLGAWGVCG